MKFAAAVAITGAAAAASLTVSAADVCAIDKLQEIMTTPYTLQCMSESKLEFGKLTGAPTPAQVQGFCKSATCASLLKAVLAKNPPDCVVPGVNLTFRSGLFDPIAKACAGATTTNTGNSTSNSTGSSNSTSSVNKNTVTNNTVGSNLDNNTGVPKSDDTTDTSSSATKTPTPSPTKSAASSFAVSACATAFGVAAALVLML